MATQFCGEYVNVGFTRKLWVDGNSKITRSNGTYDNPAPNAFSLAHIKACPGATPTCASTCYVHGLRKAVPSLWHRYDENLQTLKQILDAPHEVRQLAAKLFGEWISEHCPGGFRWHVSGDVISYRHWYWIESVCHYASETPCWIYTRSFDLIRSTNYEELPANLTINLSADRDNLPEALEAFENCQGHRICYMAHADETPEALPDLPNGSVIFPDYAHRGRNLAEPTSSSWWQVLSARERRMVCPADFFGQSEQHRCGPCSKCLTNSC